MHAEQQMEGFRQDFLSAEAEIAKVIVGLGDVVRGVLTCLFADGHALLEGVPGLGKTLLVRTLAETCRLRFSRVQFTPDLMPADVTGTNIIAEDDQGRKYFEFKAGPIFANIILADEINRATPKTQSALLEAMQERQVTVAGETRPLGEPFIVLATQNPIEMEGTYPLPEAQLDRFLLKLQVPFPKLGELETIVDRTTGVESSAPDSVLGGERLLEMRALTRQVLVAEHVKRFALRLVLATHPGNFEATEMVKQYVRYGASPRGGQALVLAGKVRALLDARGGLSFDDVAVVAKDALRHRIILNFEAEAEGIETDAIIDDLLAALPRETVASP
jgi:MoxR-like ATPase